MKRFLCIGGPYDGLKLTSDDLTADWVSRGPTRWNPYAAPAGTLIRAGGQYGKHASEYYNYNRSNGLGPTMVRIHKSLLP